MKTIILILALLSWNTLALAQEPTGEQLRKDGLKQLELANTAADYAAAEETARKGVDLLKQAAEKNDAEAEFVLGTLVLTQSLPPGLEVDPLEMFLKSAKQGNEDAVYGICALAFQKVPIKPEDQGWLIKQLEEKTAAGSKESAAVLAPIYFIFGHKEQFEARLAKLTGQADAGDAESQYLLGTIYLDPAHLGFPKDVKKGLKYLDQAAAAKYTLAQLFLGETYINEAEIKDVDKGLGYLDAAAESGITEYQTHVGLMYYQLGRSEEDFKKAFKWLSAAAAKNDHQAQYYLANMYQKGQGVAADPQKAEELIKESEKP